MRCSSDLRTQLARMEDARRQTQRQLNMIERLITRRMSATIPMLKPRYAAYRHGKPPDPHAFLERYRSNLAAITAELQPEIDALSGKLARQDAAIEAVRCRDRVRTENCREDLRRVFERDEAAQTTTSM